MLLRETQKFIRLAVRTRHKGKKKKTKNENRKQETKLYIGLMRGLLRKNKYILQIKWKYGFNVIEDVS